MCATCGCGEGGEVRLTLMPSGAHDHPHDRHPHDHHPHDHHPPDHHPPDHHQHLDGSDNGAAQTVILEQQIFAKNGIVAERNRHWLKGRGILALNLMSSPGSGKTTLLERTIRDVGAEFSISVIEGDQETPLDAERIRATGRPVVQINTGSGCHLDATMVERAFGVINPPSGSVMFIENVGNLVCPALFDLGERARVIIMSVTEGADKPLKYPQMFRTADLVLLNKADLLPYVSFELADFAAAVRQVNPGVKILLLSATSGEGVESWYRELHRLKG
jgi:hydrogenase nickel incorporation protein HypB